MQEQESVGVRRGLIKTAGESQNLSCIVGVQPVTREKGKPECRAPAGIPKTNLVFAHCSVLGSVRLAAAGTGLGLPAFLQFFPEQGTG